jgi:hypothetical protein
MALNPFFLHGSPGEQRLLQDLTNELIRSRGIDVLYIPRKFVRKQTILEEIQSSRFDDNFAIEAFLLNYDGYSGSGDILSKFGVSIKDDVTLAISKERFEDFIGNFLSSMDPNEIEVSSRPREGDLIYFPLGQRLFEVKNTEHESLFYPLGKLYHYELTCELFEYEDEVIDTNIEEVDEKMEDVGYLTELRLIGSGTTAIVTPNLGTGYVKEVTLIQDGYGYISAPQVVFTEAPLGGITASAVAITTSFNNVYSVKEVLITNAGRGYQEPPQISFVGGSGGIGAVAKCSIEKNTYGIVSVNIVNQGNGYTTTPTITVSSPGGIGNTSILVSSIQNNRLSSVKIKNAGNGYNINSPVTVTVQNPSLIAGQGNYIYNEVITGSISGTTARVRRWDADTKYLKVYVINGEFYPGELIVGAASSAIYAVNQFTDYNVTNDKYNQNKDLQEEGNNIVVIDFNDKNPFGEI